MNEITLKKLAEITKDNAANERLENANGIEEVVAILNEYGVEVSVEELKSIAFTASNDELSVEDLEQVVGGAGWWKKAWGHIKAAINGLLDGFNGSYSN